jgi:myo-inositol-1(or 4)-monophosphatase
MWIADPIDGTASFIGGSSDWCIALALLEDGAPVIGIIHAPALEETYMAARAEGASLNGRPLHVASRRELQDARVFAAGSLLRPERWTNPLPPLQPVRVPSLALRLAGVASGSADAAIALVHKHDWDLASGDIIVREAGGIVSDLAGEALVYDAARRRSGFIAANPNLHRAILAHGPKFTTEGKS